MELDGSEISHTFVFVDEAGLDVPGQRGDNITTCDILLELWVAQLFSEDAVRFRVSH